LITYLSGHFKKITAAKWLISKLNSSFLTCSYDMSLCLWSHSGDRWSFSSFDIPMLIDPSLRHYRFCSEVSTIPGGSSKNLQLTSLAIHPKHLYAVCGSAQGSLWFLDLSNNKLLNYIKPSSFRIIEMSFSPSGNFLAIAYSNGSIMMYDVRANFELLLELESPVKTNSKCENLHKLYYIGVVLFQEPSSSALESTIISSKMPSSYISEPAFYSISSHNFSVVRVQKIYVKAGKLIKDLLVDLLLDEGKIAGFDVHPSREYAFLLNDVGYLYIYQLHLAQLRGKIRVLPNAWGCKIDPSGLYVAIAAPPRTDNELNTESKPSIHCLYLRPGRNR